MVPSWYWQSASFGRACPISRLYFILTHRHHRKREWHRRWEQQSLLVVHHPYILRHCWPSWSPFRGAARPQLGSTKTRTTAFMSRVKREGGRRCCDAETVPKSCSRFIATPRRPMKPCCEIPGNSICFSICPPSPPPEPFSYARHAAKVKGRCEMTTKGGTQSAGISSCIGPRPLTSRISEHAQRQWSMITLAHAIRDRARAA